MDILLLILLAVGFVSGLFSGAVKQVISLAAFLIGFGIACLFYQDLADVLTGFLSMATLCKVVSFVTLWVVVPIVVKVIASLLTSALNVMPVLGLLNRLLGGILGVAKYALVLGAIVWLFASANLIKEETMQQSRLARPLKSFPEFVYNALTSSSSADTTERSLSGSDAPDAACDTVPDGSDAAGSTETSTPPDQPVRQ